MKYFKTLNYEMPNEKASFRFAKRILVTGGNGFLGRYIVKELLKYNYDITISSNKKSSGTRGVKAILLDVTNKKKVIHNVKNFDTVYHIAGNIRTPKTDTKKLHFAVNGQGTYNMLEACRIHNIKRFIFISTVEVYGNAQQEHIKESSKKIPLNEYAKSKLLAEDYCKEYSKKYGIAVTVIRPSYIYGYGQYKGRLFSKLINDALNKKKTNLKPLLSGNDFVYVKDVAIASVLLGKRKQVNNFEDYNVASGKFTTIKEVFESIKSLTGCIYNDQDIIDKNAKKISFSIEKAKKVGYNPIFNIKRGLADYIKEVNFKKIK